MATLKDPTPMPIPPSLYLALNTQEPLADPLGLLNASNVYVVPVPSAAAPALRLAKPAPHAAGPLLNHCGGVMMPGEKRSPMLSNAWAWAENASSKAAPIRR